MEGMEREELQCVAASYGVDFDDKADVKVLGHITHKRRFRLDIGHYENSRLRPSCGYQ